MADGFYDDDIHSDDDVLGDTRGSSKSGTLLPIVEVPSDQASQSDTARSVEPMDTQRTNHSEEMYAQKIQTSLYTLIKAVSWGLNKTT